MYKGENMEYNLETFPKKEMIDKNAGVAWYSEVDVDTWLKGFKKELQKTVDESVENDENICGNCPILNDCINRHSAETVCSAYSKLEEILGKT